MARIPADLLADNPYDAIRDLPDTFLATLDPKPGTPGGPRPCKATMMAWLVRVRVKIEAHVWTQGRIVLALNRTDPDAAQAVLDRLAPYGRAARLLTDARIRFTLRGIA